LCDCGKRFGSSVSKKRQRSEPEDHAAILCEIMAGLAGGGIAAPRGADRDFFGQLSFHVETHVSDLASAFNFWTPM
jgi:TorA maturation chaperone TorD